MSADARPPGLSVVIVSWNASPVLGDCLRSLIDNPPDRPWEILMLDNASSDGSAGLARGFGPGVTVVELGANRGFAGACNEGYRRSSFEYLLFLNSDVRVRPSALERLCGFMDSHPEAAAAGGLLVGDDGRPQRGFNVRAFPTLASAAFEILMLDEVFPGNPVTRRQRMLDFEASEPVPVDQPAGACLLIRKGVFRDVGLFDEDFYPAWFEDVDLCLRLRRKGHRVYFVPLAVFDHRGGASVDRLSPSDRHSIWYRSLHHYFYKHGGRTRSVLVRALILLGMLERMTVAVFARGALAPRRRVTVGAYWRVFREALWPKRAAPASSSPSDPGA